MDEVDSRDKKTAALSDILIYIEEQNIDLRAQEAIALQHVMQSKTACSLLHSFLVFLATNTKSDMQLSLKAMRGCTFESHTIIFKTKQVSVTTDGYLGIMATCFSQWHYARPSERIGFYTKMTVESFINNLTMCLSVCFTLAKCNNT